MESKAGGKSNEGEKSGRKAPTRGAGADGSGNRRFLVRPILGVMNVGDQPDCP
jgi:hypothetical protein